MKIWLDDLRTKPNYEWKHFTTSEDAIRALKVYKAFGVRIEAISFDHDLGGDDTTRPVILWMIEHEFWPKQVYVHTANPVGREWLVGMTEAYGPGVTYATSELVNSTSYIR